MCKHTNCMNLPKEIRLLKLCALTLAVGMRDEWVNKNLLILHRMFRLKDHFIGISKSPYDLNLCSSAIEMCA